MYYLTQTGVGFTQDDNLPSGAVACTQEQATSGKYKLLNGNITLIDTLNDDKSAKKRELSEQCKATLLGGFFSPALGETHKYGSSEADQRNLIAFVTSGTNASLWFAKDDNWTLTEHTPEQLKQVLIDWQVFLQTQQQKLIQLIAQADNCQNINDLDKVTYDN